MSTTEAVPETNTDPQAPSTEDTQVVNGASSHAKRDTSRPSLAKPDPETLRRACLMLAPALIYLGIRELGLLCLAWMSEHHNVSMVDALASWDGEWYLGIAAGGYDGVPEGLVDAYGNRTAETPLAFFPGYPTLIRWLEGMDGAGGTGFAGAAIAVSVVAGVFCAYALARMGELVAGGSARAGYALVALFAASPMGIVLSMAYSEALFCALAAWALVGVLRRNWLQAGLCCAGAGLVRPTAAALVLAVGLAALYAVTTKRDGWRAVAGGLLAPAGLLGYLGWVAARTGDLGGYFALQQRGWDSQFDGGLATISFTIDTLLSARSILEVGTVALIALFVALVVVGFTRRLEWPLLTYGAMALLMDIGSNGMMNSKARLLIPAFTLLVPVAVALAKRRPVTMVVTLSAVAVVGSWFGAYSLTAWQYAI